MSERMLVLFSALALVACGGADAPDPAPGDSATAALVPTTVIAGDTLIGQSRMRCGNGQLVSVGYFKGATRRAAVNLVGDTGLWARATAADTGERYATLDESLIWWTKGDTTSLEWQGRITTCVVDSTIEF